MSNYRRSWNYQRANSPRRITQQAHEHFRPELANELTRLAMGFVPIEPFPSEPPPAPTARRTHPRFVWAGWADEAHTLGIVYRGERRHIVRAGSPSARRIKAVQS